MTVGDTGENLGYILALPRSGSTLLSAMLDNHPAIISPPEPWIMLALHSLGVVHERHPADSNALGTAFDAFVDEEMRKLGTRAAATALYNHKVHSSGKSFFLDKTPRYYMIADFILSVFPDAKLIWLQRNPFAIAASYRTTWGLDIPQMIRSGENHPALLDFMVGMDVLERFHAVHSDRMHMLQYEQLIADPITTLRALAIYLGQPVPDETLSVMTNLRDLDRTTKQFGDTKILATTAPHTRSRDQWKEEFSVSDLQTLFDVLGRERLTMLGYSHAVDEALELGVIDNGPDAVQFNTQRCRSLMISRLSDMARASSYQGQLPRGVHWNMPPRDRE